jgi:uncharacterized LabA/DUF88 family protein
VSKNVAVFVDVANIFYAAKAAGVDIDYVTLLKSATANRDFVRAYAYTGLDPENENQRQFHSFLARSGYKVISKDIRKYGDGRIKANLDIELVVDMMKTARNLDIAVVVSGDGDFAPAIRAVQEQGVRVEVISFRGNTSSDLIEVADQFTDIAQIARVEKGSARSGRRVAAEGDLSMTEVPEKETEGAPRRRRGPARREERPVEVEAEPSNLVVLPGERLSRAPEDEIEVDADDEAAAAYGASENGAEPLGEEARRRRRRRGGRGRGRGRRADEPQGDEQLAAAPRSEDEEEFEDVAAPTQLPTHTFGSVWDSQIGIPAAASAGAPVGAPYAEEEEDEDSDEPEVPEYLLAERRQRGQRPVRSGARAPRGRSAYQAALDRERFGRSAPQPSFGSGQRPDRGRDRDRGGRPQGGRPQGRPPREDRAPMMEPRQSSEPWSEVPPELEEMLRAELARKQPGGSPSGPRPSSSPRQSTSPAPSTPDYGAQDLGGSDYGAPSLSGSFEETSISGFGTATDAVADDAAAPAKPTRARRSTKAASSEATGEATSDAEAPAVAKAPAKRATRTTASTAKAPSPTRSRSTKAAATQTAAADEAATEEPKKPARRRSTKATAEEG